jgi:hypothetical protein
MIHPHTFSILRWLALSLGCAWALSACGGDKSDAGGDGKPDPQPNGINIALVAQASTSMVSPWETLAAVNDDSEPRHSNDKSQGAYGNWNSPDSYQWVQYQWARPVTISRSDIYWFDDGGGVLTPTEAFLEYWNGTTWLRLGDFPLLKDTFNSASFTAVTTERLRVTMRNSQESTGILEWRVWGELPANYHDPLIPPPMGEYTPVTTQYQHRGINTDNSAFRDSAHFRIYYAANSRNGPNGELGSATDQQLTALLDHLEAAYQLFVMDMGFRSAGQSVHSHINGRYKLNVYLVSTIDGGAAGVMLYNANAGLSFLEVRSDQINLPHVTVHEYGHCLTLAEYKWVDKAATGAWWETTAQWVADLYQGSPAHAQVAAKYGQTPYSTLFEPNVVIGQSHLSIIHRNNLYQIWPFFTYLTNNPDNFPGLGRDAIRNLIRQHQGQETPLHTLARMTSPISVQQILGQYHARLAYVDINHTQAQQRFMQIRNIASFRQQAYNNLERVGTNEYRVRAARKPLYGGSNLIPLQASESEIYFSIQNLGNGLADSALTATVALRSASGAVRYVPLQDGVGSVQLQLGEEATLVVVNTPTTLYQFNAFESTDESPELRGLDYQVQIIGAVPRELSP